MPTCSLQVGVLSGDVRSADNHLVGKLTIACHAYLAESAIWATYLRTLSFQERPCRWPR